MEPGIRCILMIAISLFVMLQSLSSFCISRDTRIDKPVYSLPAYWLACKATPLISTWCHSVPRWVCASVCEENHSCPSLSQGIQHIYRQYSTYALICVEIFGTHIRFSLRLFVPLITGITGSKRHYLLMEHTLFWRKEGILWVFIQCDTSLLFLSIQDEFRVGRLRTF